MTLSFWIIVGLLGFFAWVFLMDIFIPLGKKISKKWKKFKNIIDVNNPENKDDKNVEV